MTAILRGHLTRRLDRCSPDELRILDRILLRLERRRERAGSLDLAKRPDVFAELNEGLIDAVIACTILTIRAEDERHDEERRKALLASAGDDEAAELARWQADDQRTRVSDVSQVIAATPEAVPEPVVEWEAGEGPRSTRGAQVRTLGKRTADPLECSNCGHALADHDATGRCSDTERWYDGRRAHSGPCSCRSGHLDLGEAGA